MMDRIVKQQINSKIRNFKSCCRFLKITDKNLYYDHLANSGVQDCYNFRVFQSILDARPTCIFNKYPKVYESIDRLHLKLITKVHNELRKYMD